MSEVPYAPPPTSAPVPLAPPTSAAVFSPPPAGQPVVLSQSSSRKVYSVLFNTVMVVLIAAVVFMIWPVPYGGRVTIARVVGTSMQPMYHTGDVVMAVKPLGDYHVGDVVVYVAKVGNTSGYIVHKIVGQNANGTFVLKGVNKKDKDPWDVPAANIRGKVVFLIPQGARYIGLLHNRWGTAVILGLLVTALLWPSKKAGQEVSDEVAVPDGDVAADTDKRRKSKKGKHSS